MGEVTPDDKFESDSEQIVAKRQLVFAIMIIGMVLFTAMVGLWMARASSPKIDEPFHYAQIKMFSMGQWEMYRYEGDEHPFLAMIPGYHLVTAGLLHVIGYVNPFGARILSCLTGLLLFGTFLLLSRRLDRPNAMIRSGQLFFLPVLFPFYFLVYTDAFSLWLIVLSLLFTLSSIHWAGGLAGLLSLLVRQNGIPLVAAISLACMRKEGSPLNDCRKWDWRLKVWGPFIPAALFFWGFYFWNDRQVALTAPEMQQLTLSWGNLLLLLVLTSLWMLPIQLKQLPDLWRDVKVRPVRYIAVLIVIGLLVFFYQVRDHRNFDFPILLRNDLLLFLVGGVWQRFIMFFLASWAAFNLMNTKWVHPAGEITIYLWLLCLLPVLLVEPRYYIPLVAWYLIFRKHECWRWETAQLAVFVLLACTIHYVHMKTIYLI